MDEEINSIPILPEDYFSPRDFEIVQPIYDLTFLLKITALAKKIDEPKYRVLSLNTAAHNLDGYSSSIIKWLKGKLSDDELDYLPTNRIRDLLSYITKHGTIPEREDLLSPQSEGCLRLRGIRGVGPALIERFLVPGADSSPELLTSCEKRCGKNSEEISAIFNGETLRKWQAAHIIPPLLRLLKSIETRQREKIKWQIKGIDGFSLIEDDFKVYFLSNLQDYQKNVRNISAAIEEDAFFRLNKKSGVNFKIQHSMGWFFELLPNDSLMIGKSVDELAWDFDPLAQQLPIFIKSDLHTHSFWSDGIATPENMVQTAMQQGLEYIAITDHSRSSKLQKGLTPPIWLRQGMSVSHLRDEGRVLHGMEVDILPDGNLDMPEGILTGMDIVVASIHSGWGHNIEHNTSRIIRAIETGYVDVLGHPSCSLIGRPGIPAYIRPPIPFDWDAVLATCAKWRVAIEINCFPSRLDISKEIINKAFAAGCSITLGSDAHSRFHLDLIKFGVALTDPSNLCHILNSLNIREIKQELKDTREVRRNQHRTSLKSQMEIFRNVPSNSKNKSVVLAHRKGRSKIPEGSIILGIDLTAGKNRKTAVALLSGNCVETASLRTDEELMAYIQKVKPAIVSIDSPLGLPGGGKKIDPDAGIVRVAERDLASIGISAYPALIDSMKNLTLRGIRLRGMIESLDNPPTVIESYPGAAQDLFAIPRKQRGLNLLIAGLKEMGLKGRGLLTKSHDEMDAITSAIVGRFYETGKYEAMGIPSEAQLIVPKTSCLKFDNPPVICLAGDNDVGKSVVSRYLALYYGFYWVNTYKLVEELIRDKLINVVPSNFQYSNYHPFNESFSGAYYKRFIEDTISIAFKKKLTETILNINGAMVIDSIYTIDDLDINYFNNRDIYIWYVDRSSKQANKLFINKNNNIINDIFLKYLNLIDFDRIKDYADMYLINNASLEKLHWIIDDFLFNIIKIVNNEN